MSKILLESDFITINVKQFFTKEQDSVKQPENTDNITDTTKSEDQATDNAGTEKPTENRSFDDKTDWDAELKRRLEADKKLHPEARERPDKLMQKFWTDFFTANFGTEVAEKLLGLFLLKSDLQKIGFDEETNPLLSFLKIEYVQKELILTGLINNNTYKVIHNVYAKSLVNHTEMSKENDYNIIYCRDLYKNPISDMQKYFEYQKELLPFNTNTYNAARKNKNKQVFLVPGSNSVLESEAKLKELSDIAEVVPKNSEDSNNDTKSGNNGKQQTKSSSDSKLHTAASQISNLGNKGIQAALLYTYMTTGAKVAKKAAGDATFGTISAKDLTSAMADIKEYISNITLTKSNAEYFVELLTDRIKS